MNLMNLDAYTRTHGTYCAAYVNKAFVPAINSMCAALGLPDPDPSELHCTIMYSPEGVCESPVPKQERPIAALLGSVQHWVGHNGKTYVVADLQSMALCELHARFARIGCKSTFAAFKPHITLGTVDEATPELDAKVEALNWRLKTEPLHIVFTDLRTTDIRKD